MKHLPPLTAFVLLVAATCAVAEGPKLPLKVFILVGQSNVEGQAVADLEGKDYNDGKGTLKSLLDDPATAPRFRHLRDEQGKWVVRDDVWVRFQPQEGAIKTGPLALGFTGYGGAHHFGPELQFGHVMAEHFPNQVLLIKTAWGGKSLYEDFRPPSAGGKVGPYYKQMLAEIRAALANLKTDFPAYDDRGYELAGLVWYQGWNDGCDPQHAVPEYEQNLVHLIHDVRKDLDAPGLPIVVGELTGPWVDAPGEWAALRKAQAAAAARAEFAGNVLFVETHDFVRRAEDSPCPTHGHHEFANAETYLLVGDALAKGMLQLIDNPAKATYQSRMLEGWTVHISDAVLEQDSDGTRRALELLEKQLAEIVRVVPVAAVSKLREVPLWFSPEYPNVRPSAEYHPDAGWLRDHGRNPAMARGVEFTDVRIFEAETLRMPNFALHELAHAYHDRVLSFDQADVAAAYELAKSSKSYDNVERSLGDGKPNRHERAYAMTNRMEYFAECSEAFFARNDFFPFNRAELHDHDPRMEQLLERLWGVGN